MRIEKNPKNEADVELLWRVFSDVLPDGREISHEQLEAALQIKRASSRYRTVTRKWTRRVLLERGIYLDGMLANGRGFIALTPDEMVRFGNRTVRSAGRRIKKAITVVSVPDDAALSEDVRKYRAMLGAALNKIAFENQSALRDVSRAMQPMKQLPRRSAAS